MASRLRTAHHDATQCDQMNLSDHKLDHIATLWSQLTRSKVKQRNGKMGERPNISETHDPCVTKVTRGWLLSQHKDDKASLLLMTRQNIGKWLTAIRKGSWWPDFQPGTSTAVEITWNLQPDTRWDPGSKNEGLGLGQVPGFWFNMGFYVSGFPD